MTTTQAVVASLFKNPPPEFRELFARTFIKRLNTLGFDIIPIKPPKSYYDGLKKLRKI